MRVFARFVGEGEIMHAIAVCGERGGPLTVFYLHLKREGDEKTAMDFHSTAPRQRVRGFDLMKNDMFR